MLQEPKIGVLHDVIDVTRWADEAADEAPERAPFGSRYLEV
jgi:hypothetical protein